MSTDPREPGSEEQDEAGSSEPNGGETSAVEPTVADTSPSRAKSNAGDAVAAQAEEFEAENALLHLGEDDILSISDAEAVVRQAPTPRASPPTSPPPGSRQATEPVIVPTEFALEMPTALDRFLAEQAEKSAEDQASALAAAIAAAPRADKGELAYELGELTLGALADEARAVKSYGVSLRSDPSLRANLWAIRRIFYRRGLWPNLIKLIGAELRFVASNRDRADLELERGRIHEDRLSDGEAAKACYERAVAHDPEYAPALLALERRSLIDDDRRSLAMVWRHLADVTVDPERKQTYLVDLARALTDERDARAFDVLDEAAQVGDPEFTSRERLRAARALGDAEQLVRGLEEQVAAQLGTLGPAGLPPPSARNINEAPDPAERVRLTVIAARRRQAQILSRELGDDDRAWSALEQALVTRPGDPLVLADLADLAEKSGRFEALAELVESWQSGEKTPERARALALRRVAALRHGGDENAAKALLGQLAATYPGYLPVATIRESDAIASGDVSSLVEVYAELAESAEIGSLHGSESGEPAPVVACEMFCAAAGVAQIVGDWERARTLYGRALEVDPRSHEARDGLIVCLERAGEWLEIAGQLAGHLGDDADPHWRLRASHAALAAGDRSGALEVLVSIGEALSTGELLWVAALAIVCGDAERETYALEMAAGRETDSEVIGELLARAGRSIELTDSSRAVSLYRKALVANPRDSLTRSALAALLRRERDWTALADALREGADSAKGEGGSASGDGVDSASGDRSHTATWLEVAAIHEDCLGDAAAAGDAYRRVLDDEPDSVAALSGLVRVSVGAERTAALERAAQSTEVATSLVAALELALEKLEAGDTAGARVAAARADSAERDLGRQTRAGALVAIEVAARTGDPLAIGEALENAADGSRGAVAAELLAAAGWQRFLGGDATGARTLFASARGQDASNRSALLGALLVADGEEEALAAETLAAALEGDALAVSMLRGAGVHAAVNGDDDRALELLARAVRRAPSDLGAAIALTEIAPTGGTVADALALAYARRAQAGGAGALANSLERARALAAAGRLAEAGELALELAATDDSDPAPVALLVAICQRGGDTRGEASATLELAARSVCPRARARHLRRAALIFDVELAMPGDAAPAYWQLCEIDPALEERKRLSEILEDAGDYGSLWELTSQDVERAADPAERAMALVARARLRGHIADRQGGLRDLARARKESAEDAERAGADELFAELHEWIELPAGTDGEVVCASIAERVESNPEPSAQARELVDLATICRDALGDRGRAAKAIAKARALDPTNLEAAARAGEVAEAALAIRRGLETESGHRAGYQKLAAALELLGDSDESELAREVADALGGVSGTSAPDLAVLGENRRPLDGSVFDSLSRGRVDFGVSQLLWEKIADSISRQLDPSPVDLGVDLSDRIGVRELGRRSPIAAALYERLRLHSEVYVAAERERFALVTSANRQMIFLSPDVIKAETPRARFALGAALLQSRERTGTLARLSVEQVATYFVAARSLAGAAGAPIGASASKVSAVAETLESLLPARVLAELKEMSAELETLERPAAWMSEAKRRAQRFGLALSGDITEAARSSARPGRSICIDSNALELLAYAASEKHLEMRRALGLAFGPELGRELGREQ